MRKLNFYTIKDCFPIPRIEQCLDTLCGNRYFSTLDLLSGYWQIAVHPEDIKKTAFLTKYTVFWSIKWCALACVTPQLRYSVQCSTFWAVFCGRRLSVTWMTLFRWVRILNLHSVIFVNFFYWFREHNLKVKPKKCVLFQEQVEYLGRLVSHKGVTLRSEHVHVIRNWPVPTTKQELQSYLGFANYREYIKKIMLSWFSHCNSSSMSQNRVPFSWISAIWMWSRVFEKSCAMHQFFHTPTQITHSFLIVMPVKLQLAVSCFNLMVQKRLLRFVAIL